MLVWNAGLEEIAQMYNGRMYTIKPNMVIDLTEDCAVFMINKRQVRGMGLVQLKDGDDKSLRYIEARENIYAWAKEKWNDFDRYNEERQEQGKAPVQPHKEILKYKVMINEFEKWDSEGRIIPENIKPVVEEKQKIYVCPVCMKEFDSKVGFTGHNRTHQKEEKGANDGSAVNNSGQGKG